MRPLLDKPISIRISEDEHARYSRAAAYLGTSLSEYLRLRLVSVGDDYVADQIAQLRLTLLDNLSPSAQIEQTPLMLEILLLLRRVSKPGDVGMVRSELLRLGHTPWSSSIEHTE